MVFDCPISSIADKEREKKKLARAQARLQSRMEGKVAKTLLKKGFTNEDGYIVIYKEEWFVPELGVIRIRAYDMFGAIVNETIIASII